MRSLRSLLGLAPTLDSFARELIHATGQAGQTQWRYDATERALIDPQDATHRVNLSNLFLEYRQASRAARAGLMQKYQAIFTQRTQIPKLWTLAAPQLYPALRSRYGTMTLEIDHRDSAQPFAPQVRAPWVEDIVQVLLLDHGPSMSVVPEHTAEAWGVSREALWARALANLRALPRPQWHALDGGVFQIQSEVAYEESFVLVEEVMDALPFAEHPVIALPNRGVLLAADANDRAAVNALIALTREHLQNSPWPLSGTLIERTEGGWAPYAAPDGLAAAAHSLHRVNEALTYQDQKACLEALHERTHTDVFVATCGLRADPAAPAEVRSWSTWSAGVDTLLPKTDHVIFNLNPGAQEPELILARWDTVERVCGHYLTPTQEYPPRFRVTAFPTEEERAALRRDATSH